MIVCREVSEAVTDYLERAMPLRRRLEVRLHLLRCEACRRYLEQMRRTVRLLGAQSLKAPPREAEERLVAAARQPPSD